jgi:hypothetical protein
MVKSIDRNYILISFSIIYLDSMIVTAYTKWIIGRGLNIFDFEGQYTLRFRWY